ncbi:hypothetical protein MUK42_25888 [Musa troglodytarum]|uniref:NAC domain-containing protein n=1 Tax=Musa troglodytarum TaxID=320322 RepID=A0A9E7KBC5_9LILI|nr:hypothetical protein MUK42_25888 [Musa troglodytarum]
MEPVNLVPRGYRFFLSAEELAVDYLSNWVADGRLAVCVIDFIKVYDIEPWNLLDNNQHEGHFFAERKLKNSEDPHVDRKASNSSCKHSSSPLSKRGAYPSTTASKLTQSGQCTMCSSVSPALRDKFSITSRRARNRPSPAIASNSPSSNESKMSPRSRKPPQRQSPAIASLS